MSDKKKVIPRAPNKTPPPPPSSITEDKIVYIEANVSHQPPNAIEAEIVVLGALMIDREAIKEVVDIISPKVFFLEQHKKIYAAIERLYRDGIGIDIITVSDSLDKVDQLKSIGGSYSLVSMTQKVSSAAHIEFHCRIILQKYILRRLIISSRDIISRSIKKDPDVFDMLDAVELAVNDIHSVAIRKNTSTNNESAQNQLLQKFSKVQSGENPGLYIGVDEFDRDSGGLQPRELYTFAARTGMGKTTITLAICIRLGVHQGKKVGFFSLEMSKIDLIYRVAANLSGVDFTEIRTGKLSKEDLAKVIGAIDVVNKSNLAIRDTSDHKNYFHSISKQIRAMVDDGCELVVIDYIQLCKLRDKTTDRTGDLSSITRDVKALANELGIPIIILAQISRSTDSRPGSKVPLLSDLKQSGSIEEDSDVVVFFVRMSYYQESQNGGVPIPDHIAGDTDMVVAKSRSFPKKTYRTFTDFKKYVFSGYSNV
jgi:replicative DNA helicase